jgi:hypothetical protein
MKSTIFWDIKPCRPLKDNQRFGGTYGPIFKVEKVEQETGVKAGGRVFGPEGGGDMFFRTVC